MVWNFDIKCLDPFLLYTYEHVTSQELFSRPCYREKGAVCWGFLHLTWKQKT